VQFAYVAAKLINLLFGLSSKMLAALSSSKRFQGAMLVVRISNCTTICALVISFFDAAIATLALNF
jgi:hypothetical protein